MTVVLYKCQQYINAANSVACCKISLPLGFERAVKMLCDRGFYFIVCQKNVEHYTALTAYLTVGLKILLLGWSVISEASSP